MHLNAACGSSAAEEPSLLALPPSTRSDGLRPEGALVRCRCMGQAALAWSTMRLHVSSPSARSQGMDSASAPSASISFLASSASCRGQVLGGLMSACMAVKMRL